MEMYNAKHKRLQRSEQGLVCGDGLAPVFIVHKLVLGIWFLLVLGAVAYHGAYLSWLPDLSSSCRHLLPSHHFNDTHSNFSGRWYLCLEMAFSARVTSGGRYYISSWQWRWCGASVCAEKYFLGCSEKRASKFLPLIKEQPQDRFLKS